jgi:hypothetical protein
MEFRIYNAIFCSTFKIQKSAFAFDEYVTKVFQHSVLELIEIRLKDWFYVTVLLTLNLGRVKLNWQWQYCELHDVECHERRDIYLYTACGTHNSMPYPPVVARTASDYYECSPHDAYMQAQSYSSSLLCC